MFDASRALTGERAPDPPFWFNLCRLVFIIKKGSFEVPEVGTVVDPENLRPISVANFCNRLLNAGFKVELEVATKAFCHKAQQGFIGDLLKNVLEFDAGIHRQYREGTGVRFDSVVAKGMVGGGGQVHSEYLLCAIRQKVKG